MVTRKILLLIFALFFLSNAGMAQYEISIVDTSSFVTGDSVNFSKVSFRGLSVVNDKVIWVSGSKGVIMRSVDGGETFKLMRISGYEQLDFRDIEAFSAKKAIVMCSGSPAYIFRTENGGDSWVKVFQNEDPAIFLDGMDFWNKDNGVVVGDPINGRFVLYGTKDGGASWTEFDTSMRPWAVEGEAIFAASGTSFRCMPRGSIAFVTGGKESVLHWLQIGKHYQRFPLLTMMQGKSSQGAFSFAFDQKHIIIVGGDYASDTSRSKNGVYTYTYTQDGLQLLNSRPFYTGYLSCVDWLPENRFIVCGTTGVEINNADQVTTNSSPLKTRISDLSFNVVKRSPKGKRVVLAGNKGLIGIIKL